MSDRPRSLPAKPAARTTRRRCFSVAVWTRSRRMSHTGTYDRRLVSVWGADVGLGRPREWEKVAEANRQFARERSLGLSLVKTNFRTFFNHYKLRERFFPMFPNWYSAVQQGLGLVGLCAPLSCVHRLSRIRIPSTHSEESAMPWGSHPSIDGEIRWGSTDVVHDGYDLSRQMKLALLAAYIREHDPELQLRVCWGRGRNFGSCAKCCLTMIGLAIEGLDPNRHGFRIDPGVLSFIRAQLEDGSTSLTAFRVRLGRRSSARSRCGSRSRSTGSTSSSCGWPVSRSRTARRNSRPGPGDRRP